MTITLVDILDLAPPFGIGFSPSLFAIFYIETERLITLTRNRDIEVQSSYDVIISTISASSLSNSENLKTWITQSYQAGKEDSRIDLERYYLAAVSFVKKLQLLVLDGYDSVDIFYETEGITVSQIFADISEDAGYPISPQYIEDIS